MILFAALTSLATAWLLVGAVKRIALRAGMLDVPNRRSSHVVPTPRGGGLAIVIVTLSVVAVSMALRRTDSGVGAALICGGVVVSVAGLVDDIRGLSVGVRMALQTLAALTVLLAGMGGLAPLPLPGGDVQLGIWGWILGTATIIWSINLYNFMDGVDGLAAAQALFVAGASVVFALTGGRGADEVLLPLVALAGASAGFLLWNLPPAKIFMGDVGSGFIGFFIIAAALLTTQHGPVNVWTYLILNGLFIADATSTLISRAIRGEQIFQAHRSHVYQRLARRWSSHGAVTLTYSILNVAWCLPWALAASRAPRRGLEIAALALLPLFLLAVAACAGAKDTQEKSGNRRTIGGA